LGGRWRARRLRQLGLPVRCNFLCRRGLGGLLLRAPLARTISPLAPLAAALATTLAVALSIALATIAAAPALVAPWRLGASFAA
jgi:hypothetical protein